MTIEEKAEAYDEAYARMSKAYNDNRCTIGFMNEIFPKLKENKEIEGEKIRKWLIALIKSNEYGSISNVGKMPCPKLNVLAWLEKQGNLMKALQISNAKIGELIEENYYLKEQLEKQGKNNMGISEATKKKLEDSLNEALEKETPESFNKFLDEQGEQNPANEVGNYDHKEVLQTIINEQNPAWSEEDESNLDSAIYYIRREPYRESDVEPIVDWLRHLKGRVQPQPKQEWSEEDDKICKAIIDNIQSICKEGYFVGNIGSDELIDWLKNRVQPQPKQEWNKQQVVNALTAMLTEKIKSLTEKVSDNTINDREEMFRAALIEIRSFVNSPSFQIGKDVSVVWSEEDEQYLLVCKNALAKYQTTDKWDANIIFHWLENKIKSLRPQKWKPTEKQIMALKWALNRVPYDSYTEELHRLLEQLKQL